MKTLLAVIFSTFLVFTVKSTEPARPVKQVQTEQKKIVYVLLFKWKDGVTGEKINELKSLWEGLLKKVKGFDSFEMIRLVSGEYEQAVIIEFSSEEAHQVYLQHEDHIRLSKKGPALVDKFMEYSYWK